jgi:ankyrin repeat protein
MKPAELLPLHAAVIDDDLETLRALLANGERPDAQDRLGFTPLHLAAQEGSLDAVRALLDAGASIDIENSYGNTPLFVAVFNSNGRADIIQLLRSRGADPLHANKSDQTPVGLARSIANYDVARFFTDVVE